MARQSITAVVDTAGGQAMGAGVDIAAGQATVVVGVATVAVEVVTAVAVVRLEATVKVAPSFA